MFELWAFRCGALWEFHCWGNLLLITVYFNYLILRYGSFVISNLEHLQEKQLSCGPQGRPNS